ncbi:MAG: alpha/beta hydrolase [Gemmatimonadaceae bacterium]
MTLLTVGAENDAATQLYFEDYGDGSPVVLIHGWPLSGRAWEAQVPALVAAGNRVITYDRRGFGKSSQPWSGYDYDTFADDLAALLEHLDLTGAALVGFSMGGGEVARYIAKHGSERVAKAVLASAVPPFLYKSTDNPDGGLDDATIKQFEDGVKSDRLAFLDGFTTKFFQAGPKTDLISEAMRTYSRTIASFASPKGTLDCIGAFSRTDFRGDLEEMTMPTLVIHGDSDAIVPFEVSGKRSHEALANSQLVLIKGGPHGVNVTHADEFNRELISFLAS